MTRYVIIGAGAIGGGLGGLLADAGRDVVLVARGPHATALAERGLTIRLPERSFTVQPPSTTGPDGVVLTEDDVLVLATKSQQAEAALGTWVDAPVLRHGTVAGTAGELLPIVVALNGVTGEDLALRLFERVVGACVWMPSVHLEPGEVIVRGTPTRGTFHVGPVPATRDESAVLDAIEADWGTAGLRIVRPPSVMPWKYRKLVSNLANAVQALVGGNQRMGPLIAAVQAEGRAVLAAAGVEVTSDEDESAERRASGVRIEAVAGEPDELGGSSWQSLARGTGAVETDYLNGEIVRLGRVHGIATPINATLARLARRAAAERTPPGSLTVEELAVRLGL